MGIDGLLDIIPHYDLSKYFDRTSVRDDEGGAGGGGGGGGGGDHLKEEEGGNGMVGMVGGSSTTDHRRLPESASNILKPFKKGTGINHFNLPRREKQQRAREVRQFARFIRLEKREQRQEYNNNMMLHEGENQRTMMLVGEEGEGWLDEGNYYYQGQEQ